MIHLLEYKHLHYIGVFGSELPDASAIVDCGSIHNLLYNEKKQ